MDCGSFPFPYLFNIQIRVGKSTDCTSFDRLKLELSRILSLSLSFSLALSLPAVKEKNGFPM